MKRKVTSMQIEISVKKDLEALRDEHELASVSAVIKRLLVKTDKKI